MKLIKKILSFISLAVTFYSFIFLFGLLKEIFKLNKIDKKYEKNIITYWKIKINKDNIRKQY